MMPRNTRHSDEPYVRIVRLGDELHDFRKLLRVVAHDKPQRSLRVPLARDTMATLKSEVWTHQTLANVSRELAQIAEEQ